MNFSELKARFAGHGCTSVLVKKLSANDDAKHGIYLGKSFEAVNVLRATIVEQSDAQPHAIIRLSWMTASGDLVPARGAKLILYPQYPEVRLSGFLSGAPPEPRRLLRGGMEGRILVLGVTTSGDSIAWVCAADEPTSAELDDVTASITAPRGFPFLRLELPIEPAGLRAPLLQALGAVHARGWIPAESLRQDGSRVTTKAANAGGLTLEAALGVAANSDAAPDYLGTELKSLTVKDFDRLTGSKAITVITPNPQGGYFATAGLEAFVRRYGYPDQGGEADRLNFGGVFRVGERSDRTGLTLTLEGFEPSDNSIGGKITDLSGGAIRLVDDDGRVAAAWPFPKLLSHWERKHASAAYVPAQRRKDPSRALEFRYSDRVWMGTGTDFIQFLACVASGVVYHDPAHSLKAESSAHPKTHSRSQFRIHWKDLAALYSDFREVSVRSV